jgi:hypothetical protein
MELASFVVNLVSKLFTIAQKNSSAISQAAFVRLRVCGQKMINITKSAAVEGVKSASINLSQTDLYQSLLYTAVLSLNYLGLTLLDPDELEKTAKATVRDISTTIIESPHPYSDGSDIYKTIEIPGASSYSITFTSGVNSLLLNVIHILC